MSTSTRTIDRNHVARSLRVFRDRCGIGGVEAARRSGISQSKLSKIETGRLRPRVEDVRALCNVYGASPEEQDELVELARGLKEESHRSRVTLSREAGRLQQRAQQMESRAMVLRSFQPAMVIGLLQTEAYAETVAAELLEGDSLTYQVAKKTSRRSVLDDPRKRCVFIMSEGALRWQVGDAGIMIEQIESLVEVTRIPHVRLGVVPWTTPMRVTCTHGFHLYDSAAVVFGTETAAGVLDDPDDIAVYETLFGRVEASASFGEDARRELARVAADYRMLA